MGTFVKFFTQKTTEKMLFSTNFFPSTSPFKGGKKGLVNQRKIIYLFSKREFLKSVAGF